MINFSCIYIYDSCLCLACSQECLRFEKNSKMGYWKTKVLPTIKKVFENKTSVKKAAAADACKSFDESKVCGSFFSTEYISVA